MSYIEAHGKEQQYQIAVDGFRKGIRKGRNPDRTSAIDLLESGLSPQCMLGTKYLRYGGLTHSF